MGSVAFEWASEVLQRSLEFRQQPTLGLQLITMQPCGTTRPQPPYAHFGEAFNCVARNDHRKLDFSHS
jgi:hypothetical protein